MKRLAALFCQCLPVMSLLLALTSVGHTDLSCSQAATCRHLSAARRVWLDLEASVPDEQESLSLASLSGIASRQPDDCEARRRFQED